MAIQLSDLGQVYLVCGKTDMRQGIDSLAYLVKRQFELDPFSGQVFLFCGGRKDRFKAFFRYSKEKEEVLYEENLDALHLSSDLI